MAVSERQLPALIKAAKAIIAKLGDKNASQHARWESGQKLFVMLVPAVAPSPANPLPYDQDSNEEILGSELPDAIKDSLLTLKNSLGGADAVTGSGHGRLRLAIAGFLEAATPKGKPGRPPGGMGPFARSRRQKKMPWSQIVDEWLKDHPELNDNLPVVRGKVEDRLQKALSRLNKSVRRAAR